jgi:hypothetical protein
MRSPLIFIALSLVLLGTVQAQQSSVVAIGGRAVTVSIPDGYVRTTEKLPKLFELTSAALPPGNRLVEFFIAESDLDDIKLGKMQTLRKPNFQIQTIRAMESVEITPQDWQQGREIMAKELGIADLGTLIASERKQSNARVSGVAGSPVDIQFGELGKPQQYGNDPDSLRFTLLLPMTLSTEKGTLQTTVAAVGVITVLNKRLVMLYGYASPDVEGGIEALRANVDAIVERTRALP